MYSIKNRIPFPPNPPPTPRCIFPEKRHLGYVIRSVRTAVAQALRIFPRNWTIFFYFFFYRFKGARSSDAIMRKPRRRDTNTFIIFFIFFPLFFSNPMTFSRIMRNIFFFFF